MNTFSNFIQPKEFKGDVVNFLRAGFNFTADLNTNAGESIVKLSNAMADDQKYDDEL